MLLPQINNKSTKRYLHKIIIKAQKLFAQNNHKGTKILFAQNNHKITKCYLHESNHKSRKCSLATIITKVEHTEHAVCTKIIVKSHSPVFVQIRRNVLIIIFTTVPTKVQNVSTTLPTNSESLCIRIIAHTSTVPNLSISIHTSFKIRTTLHTHTHTNTRYTFRMVIPTEY